MLNCVVVFIILCLSSMSQARSLEDTKAMYQASCEINYVRAVTDIRSKKYSEAKEKELNKFAEDLCREVADGRERLNQLKKMSNEPAFFGCLDSLSMIYDPKGDKKENLRKTQVLQQIYCKKYEGR